LAEQTKGATPEAWAQLLNMQNPLMQGMMGSYVEQSKTMFETMQEQMQKQTEQMFGAFGLKR
jgi:polyhydroxyalkanoate synthesis regulator protein